MSLRSKLVSIDSLAVTAAFAGGAIVAATLLELSVFAGNVLELPLVDHNRWESTLAVVGYAVLAGLIVDAVRIAASWLDSAWSGARPARRRPRFDRALFGGR